MRVSVIVSVMLFVGVLAEVGYSQGSTPINNQVYGEWSGPYELNVKKGVLHGYPDTREIVHAAVLPPAMTGDGRSRVLFQARHEPTDVDGDGGCACVPDNLGTLIAEVSGGGWGRSFVWKPHRPTATKLVPPPSGLVQDGSQMLFCGGHTFLPNGDLLWVGGTNGLAMCDVVCSAELPAPLSCDGEELDTAEYMEFLSHPQCGDETPVEFFGSKNAWRLNTSVDPPVWRTSTAMLPGPPLMNKARWYPTAITLNRDRVLVAGHLQAPGGFQGQERAVLDLSVPSSPVWTDTANNTGTFVDPCAIPSEPLQFLDYPRLHVLSTGHVVHSNPNNGDICFPLISPTRLFALKSDDQCNAEDRWALGASPNESRLNGSSVHVIGYDEGAISFKEAIYAIGGSTEEFEGLPCQCGLDPSHIMNSVEKFVPDPNVGLPNDPVNGWHWDATPADLNVSRVNHNAVIMADGSILVVAGEATEPIDPVPTDGAVHDCVSRRTAERYMPPEIFPNAVNQWQIMDTQLVGRNYHSVAGLLPDGRVFSAGGANLNHVDNPEGAKNGSTFCEGDPCIVSDDPNSPWDVPDHSVEIFAPPYFFRDRPEIDRTTLKSPYQDTYGYGELMTFTVTLAPETSLKRVAIIKNCAPTHAFDMSQRYVELRVNTITAGSAPNEIVVTAFAPDSSFKAPEGFYMLVVSDDNLGTPSPAQWVRFE